MLFELILELFGDLFFAGASTVAVGTVAITEIATEGEVVLSKNYENEDIIWNWGFRQGTFNLQDFIGLSLDEINILIPDTEEEINRYLRTWDDYELNLTFNKQGICIKAEYARPYDPEWPQTIGGSSVMKGKTVQSKTMTCKKIDDYYVYLDERNVFASAKRKLYYAEIKERN